MKAATLAACVLLMTACAASAQRADDIDPKLDAARINVRLGIEYLKQGQLAIAREKVDKALQQYPRDVGVQLGAGILYEQLDDPKAAEKHYRQALRLEPGNPEAQNALGAFLCRKGEAKSGEETFLKAAQNPLYRTPEVAYTNAGVCARRAGRLEQAEEYLRLALAQRGQYREALLQMAGVSFERGNGLHARAFLQRYMAVTAPAPEALLLAVQVERSMGDADAAGDYASQLRSKFPDSPEARILDEVTRQESP